MDCQVVQGGSPEAQPDPQVGFGRVRGPGAVQGDRPTERSPAITSDTLRHESAARLRQAVASEAYDDIRGALAEYGGHVEAALANLPSNALTLADLAREANELMEWALQVLRIARTRNGNQ